MIGLVMTGMLAPLWGLIAAWWCIDHRGATPRTPTLRESVSARESSSADSRGPGPWWWIAAVVLAATFGPQVAMVSAIPMIVRWNSRRVRRRRAAEQFDADLVAVLDQLAVCVASGLTLVLALVAVGRVADGPVGEWLRAIGRRLDSGDRLATSLETTAAEVGGQLPSIVGSIIARERSGAPQEAALRAASTRQRQLVDQRRDERTRRLPVWLLLPLTMCVLPAVAIVIVIPQLASATLPP